MFFCVRTVMFGKLIHLGLPITVYRSYIPTQIVSQTSSYGHLKVLKTPELSGALPRGPLPGALPLDPTGALKLGPGPHTVRHSAYYGRPNLLYLATPLIGSSLFCSYLLIRIIRGCC